MKYDNLFDPMVLFCLLARLCFNSFGRFLNGAGGAGRESEIKLPEYGLLWLSVSL